MKIGYNFLDNIDEQTQKIIIHLCENDTADEHEIFRDNKKRNKKIDRLPYSRETAVTGAKETSSWIYKELFLPFVINESKMDIFLGPSLNVPMRQPVKTAVVVKDINPAIFSDEKIKGIENRIKYTYRLRSAAKADKIITHSEITKKILASKLGIRENRISVMHLPYDDRYFPVFKTEKIDNFKAKHQLTEPYYIYSGGFSERSGLKETVELFYGYLSLKNRCCLLIEGDPPRKLKDQIAKIDVRGKIRFVGKLPSDELCIAFNGAVAFITASKFENYCQEALNCIACGIPVIAFKNSCFMEILGTTSIYADNGDKKDFIRLMRDARENQNLRLKIRALGTQHANNFTTERSSASLLKILKDIKTENHIPDEK